MEDIYLYSKKLKIKFIFFSLLLIFMILVPLLSLQNHNAFSCNKTKNNKVINISKNIQNRNYFLILDTYNNNILKIPDKEFLYSVVASEMPVLFEPEAIKAQAVASYTYFCKKRQDNQNSKKNNYDFEVNSQKSLNYITKQELHNRWGSNFENYYNKIKNCVDSVFPEVMQDDKNDLVLAVYHAMSSGVTEKSQDVFTQDLNYLTNVQSPGDKLAKGYKTTSEFLAQNFKNKILSYKKLCKLDNNNILNWVKNPVRTSGGMVKEITIGSEKFSGSEIREIFNLRSANFNIIYNQQENKFVFSTFGYGHGVGMSQYGAQHMAQQGADYKQILSTYYPGTIVLKLNY